LIAVTGSNGKTTVTQMIASILRAHVGGQGEAALATRGNFNNSIGMPLNLLRMTDAHRIAVLEMGMNHPGEIAELAAIGQPTVALVNNAQREHQDSWARWKPWRVKTVRCCAFCPRTEWPSSPPEMSTRRCGRSWRWPPQPDVWRGC
jgi:UDP-N-acetylmuramate-alanine ligase